MKRYFLIFLAFCAVQGAVFGQTDTPTPTRTKTNTRTRTPTATITPTPTRTFTAAPVSVFRTGVVPGTGPGHIERLDTSAIKAKTSDGIDVKSYDGISMMNIRSDAVSVQGNLDVNGESGITTPQIRTDATRILEFRDEVGHLLLDYGSTDGWDFANYTPRMQLASTTTGPTTLKVPSIGSISVKTNDQNYTYLTFNDSGQSIDLGISPTIGLDMATTGDKITYNSTTHILSLHNGTDPIQQTDLDDGVLWARNVKTCASFAIMDGTAVTDSDIGKAVGLSDNNEISFGTNGGAFLGVLVDTDSGNAIVCVSGIVEVPYHPALPPTLGGMVVVSGNGLVKTSASGRGLVLAVNSGTEIATILIP